MPSLDTAVWIDGTGRAIPSPQGHGALIRTAVTGDAGADGQDDPSDIDYGLRHFGWVQVGVSGRRAYVEFEYAHVQAQAWEGATAFLYARTIDSIIVTMRRSKPGTAAARLTRPRADGAEINAVRRGIDSGRVVDFLRYASRPLVQSYSSIQAFGFAAISMAIQLESRVDRPAFTSRRLDVERISDTDTRMVLVDWYFRSGRVDPSEWSALWESGSIDTTVVSRIDSESDFRYDWIGGQVPVGPGQTRAGMIGRRVLDLSDPDFAARTWAHYRDVAAGARPTFHEITLCLQGVRYEYQRLALPCLDASGVVTHVVAHSAITAQAPLDYEAMPA